VRQVGWLRWLLILLVGALVGSLIGNWVGEYLPVVGKAVSWGFRLDDVHVADVFTFQLGLTFRFNIFTLVGLAIAAWVLRRA